MDKFHMLSGDELVAQGAKKGNVSLPEIGLKEVFPNGSWLEQKQIQNALEARKHLLEVERIEKCGALSHAQWREDLQLAEVTQKCGGHWQYLGHNVGKHLFIRPEEALLLLETNCLHLKYNDVTVSIQQAYSLLLSDEVPLYKYKVYSSLSRLGYKVLRHDPSLNIQTKKQTNDIIVITDDPVKDLKKEPRNEEIVIPTDVDPAKDVKTEQTNKTAEDKVQDNLVSENDVTEDTGNDEQGTLVKEEANREKETVTMEVDQTIEVSSSVDVSEKTSNLPATSAGSFNKGSADFIQYKLDVLCSRQAKPCNSHMVHESFNELLPDLCQRHIVTIKAPDEKHIPRNVFLNNTAYVLNLENLRLKNVTPAPSSSSRTYSSSDDVNDLHMGRIRSSAANESVQSNWTPQFFPNMRYSQQTNHYRPFNYWNHFNFTFQRAFYPPLRFQVFPRMQQQFRFFPSPGFTQNVQNDDPGRARKRKRVTTKTYHLESIRKLASKLKSLVESGNRQVQNIQALQKLIHTYNIRYKAMIQLTEQLEILENEVILETINLDEDDQSSPEKRLKNDENNLYEENFKALKNLALKIKELDGKKELSPRHRRAFSNAIKSFNRSYDADIYVDSNNDVISKREIVIASSSDSERPSKTPKPKKGKKLRNPFHIMKQLSEKNATKVQLEPVEKSSSGDTNCIINKNVFEYSEVIKSTFGNWLPSEEDFGKAEVVHKHQKKYWLMDHSKEFLYEFMKERLHNNWLEAKIAYWESCKESEEKYEDNMRTQTSLTLNSIISPEDCTDFKSVLKKLSIIKTNKDVKEECSLRIDFDVYNRDVQHFKKTNKPKPHFRVSCIQEDAPFPSGIDFATHSKQTDDLSVVFAIVGTSSVTYLQVNNTDLPVYIPAGNTL